MSRCQAPQTFRTPERFFVFRGNLGNLTNSHFHFRYNQCRPGRSRGGTCPGQGPPLRWTGPRWSSNSRSETSSYSHSSERRWGGRGYLSAPPPTRPTSWHGSGCPAWRCAGRTWRRRTPPRCSIVQTRRPRWQGNTIVQKFSLISLKNLARSFQDVSPSTLTLPRPPCAWPTFKTQGKEGGRSCTRIWFMIFDVWIALFPISQLEIHLVFFSVQKRGKVSAILLDRIVLWLYIIGNLALLVIFIWGAWKALEVSKLSVSLFKISFPTILMTSSAKIYSIFRALYRYQIFCFILIS